MAFAQEVIAWEETCRQTKQTKEMKCPMKPEQALRLLKKENDDKNA